MNLNRIRLMVPLSLVATVLLLTACRSEATAPTNTTGVISPTEQPATTHTPDTAPNFDVDIPATVETQEVDEPDPSEPGLQAAPPPERNEDLYPLLLSEEDSIPPRAILTQTEAGELEDADCEQRLCAHGVYQVTASLNLVDVRFDQYLFHYPNSTSLEERITAMQSPGAIGGLTLHSRPPGSKLAPNTIILEIDNARAILTWYDLWEIFIFTENPEVETRAAIDTLNRLAEIQIDKLIDAGYFIQSQSQEN